MERVLDKQEADAGGQGYRVRWYGTTEESQELIQHLYGSMTLIWEFEVAQEAARRAPETQRNPGGGGMGGDAMAKCMAAVMEAQEHLMRGEYIY